MSYILEALKKVDRERGIGGVPGLATPEDARHPQTRSNRWLWIIVALLSVNAVLVFVLLTGKSADDAQAPVADQLTAEPQTAGTNEPLVQPVRQVDEIPPSRAPAPEKPVLPQSRPAPRGGELVVLPEAAYVQNSEPVMPAEETSQTELDDLTATQDHSQLRSWYELPQEIRNSIDLPRLDVHVYSKDPRQRFIMVNLEKFREGERLASGLVVEEILPDGMVMSYRGERFRVDK